MQTLLIFTSTCKHVRLRQAGSRNLDCLHCASNASRRRCAGIQPCRTTVFSAHQMGTAAMGVDPATSVVDPQGQSWQVAGLYVADGSVLPTPSGEALALFASCRETCYCFSRPASRVRCFLDTVQECTGTDIHCLVCNSCLVCGRSRSAQRG